MRHRRIVLIASLLACGLTLGGCESIRSDGMVQHQEAAAGRAQGRVPGGRAGRAAGRARRTGAGLSAAAGARPRAAGGRGEAKPKAKAETQAEAGRAGPQRRRARSSTAHSAAAAPWPSRAARRSRNRAFPDPPPALSADRWFDLSCPAKAGHPMAHELHHRDRRAAERRQVHAVQPAGRQAPGAGRRPARRHPRPARGPGPPRRSGLHHHRYRRA